MSRALNKKPSLSKATMTGGKQIYLRDGRAPIPNSEVTSRVMSANRGRNTIPELILRRELQRLNVRGYRLHRRGIPGRPDLSFGRQRIAVFVNGCYWHRCPRCQLPLPKSHTEFWRAKFQANRRRDSEKSRLLEGAGWSVLTLWECEIREDPQAAAKRVARELKPARSRPGLGKSAAASRQSGSR